jgi:hypothetical protein
LFWRNPCLLLKNRQELVRGHFDIEVFSEGRSSSNGARYA